EPLAGRDMGAMRALIRRCAELHLRHIATSGDPFEAGSSRPLDFGHWAAHKLEQVTGFALRHGEAVAIGIALDATYSHLAGILPEQDWRRIVALLSDLGYALYVPEANAFLDQPDDTRCLLHGLTEFKEHLGGRLTVMLLDQIGHGVEVHRIDPALVAESIGRLREIEGQRLLRRAQPIAAGAGSAAFAVVRDAAASRASLGRSHAADRSDPTDPASPSVVQLPAAANLPGAPS
ncbi:MAG TPA: hypothetical protein VKT77_01200, partial [Chthonomonadaceae bacterium]|nr:hypothetical protein [Chthonomonadaceae bacterium]